MVGYLLSIRVMKKGTRQYPVVDPYRRWEDPHPIPLILADFPVAPDLDYSWHPYAECADEPEAQEAVEKIMLTGRGKRLPNSRPWEPWCSVCPVKAHCLEQGLKEDANFPERTIGKKGHRKQVKSAPFVYGGLSPHERRSLTAADREAHLARLQGEKGWLETRSKKAS